MGAFTEAQIVFAAPDGEIVAAFAPRAGIVGDLVARQPGAREAVDGRALHCQHGVVVRRDGGARLDVAYQVRLRATKPAAEILNELSKLEGISDVQFMMQDATTEM